MSYYGKRSRDKLNTCHLDLQRVFDAVVKVMDNTILYGHRTPQEQADLYSIGRTTEMHRKPVTTLDGVNKRSKHNYVPSLAIDAIPYHNGIDFNDLDNIRYFAGIVVGTAAAMGVSIRWGGDWDRDTETNDNVFEDLLHFELVL